MLIIQDLTQEIPSWEELGVGFKAVTPLCRQTDPRLP
jgi:hypothetical protein